MKLHPGTDYVVVPKSTLIEALEYFEQREDASNEGDGWQGNEAMHLAGLLREVMGER